MWKFKEKNTLPPLVLADFEDGSWHATSFAINFLWEKQLPFYILQTFKSPDWGHFMTRKLSYKLKEITNNELGKLRNKLVANYGINKQKVETLSIEGDLNSVLQCKPVLQGDYNLVLGTYSSFIDSCTMQNKYLERIIDSSEHPLFIIPGEFKQVKNKKLLLVGNPNQTPSAQLSNKIINICKDTNSELEVLFVLNKKYPQVTEDIKNSYAESFGDVKISINETAHSSTCKGIKIYLKNEQRDLIIIQNK